MADEGAFDKKTIGIAVLAISAFVVLGGLVAVLGAPEEPTPVLANRPTSTTEAPGRTDEPASSTTTTAVEPLKISFEPVPGLGFEGKRQWTYNPETRVLESVVVFESDFDDLLVTYAEVLPTSLLNLGEFGFEPLTDDVSTGDDGTEVYRFEVLTTTFIPGALRWEVTTADVLTAADLDRLAADRDEAEAAFRIIG